MTSEQTTERDASETFDVFRPGTGEAIGTYPLTPEAEVRAAVARARPAGEWWSSLGFAERRARIDRFRGIIARRSEQLAALMHDETGKPVSDAMLEIALVLGHLAWVAKHAPRVLRARSTGSSLMSPHLLGSVDYRPFGVVGVIGPWNFPVFTPLGAIISALAAGNSVVFKPSELTPGVGRWIVDAFAQVVPEEPVFQLVTGRGDTGSALCRVGVDKVAFTGSTATAKKVMGVCAESLTPMVAECGGKDALLVDEDADLEAAVDGAVWGGLMNAGQACIGTERIYVHESVYPAFLEKLRVAIAGLRAGADEGAPIGPMTLPSQVGVVAKHVADALARGGRIVAGGASPEGDEAGRDTDVVQPIVLADVPEDALANRDETFGPLLTVRPVKTMDEAVALANDTSYGLGAAVYGRSRGLELADRLRAGMVSVNAVFATAELPSSPFGGVGNSGFGRVHGEDGLREFAVPHAVVHKRFPALMKLTTFNRTKRTDDLLAMALNLVHGRH